MSQVILVVEDDADFRSVVAGALREDGYVVETAGGAHEAFQWLKASASPSLILLDFHLPEMTGADFLAIRETQPGLSVVPVVMMTGDGRTLDGDVCQGADALIMKPMSCEVLVATLRALLPMR